MERPEINPCHCPACPTVMITDNANIPPPDSLHGFARQPVHGE